MLNHGSVFMIYFNSLRHIKVPQHAQMIGWLLFKPRNGSQMVMNIVLVFVLGALVVVRFLIP